MGKKPKILKKGRLLTEEEKKELLVNSFERVKSFLIALDMWQAQSLGSPFRY